MASGTGGDRTCNLVIEQHITSKTGRLTNCATSFCATSFCATKFYVIKFNKIELLSNEQYQQFFCPWKLNLLLIKIVAHTVIEIVPLFQILPGRASRSYFWKMLQKKNCFSNWVFARSSFHVNPLFSFKGILLYILLKISVRRCSQECCLVHTISSFENYNVFL